MSLRASLSGLTQEESAWRLNDTTWTIEEVLFHVASCKLGYCRQAFGKWQTEYSRPEGHVAKTIALLDLAQEHLVECLRACTAEDLNNPVNTHSHGESAAQLFSVLLMHDLNHGSQIAMIRRAYGSLRDYDAPS